MVTCRDVVRPCRLCNNRLIILTARTFGELLTLEGTSGMGVRPVAYTAHIYTYFSKTSIMHSLSLISATRRVTGIVIACNRSLSGADELYTP